MYASRRGFTLVEILIVVIIVGILALVAIPLISGNSRDARRSEGVRMLGAARDFCRSEFAKTGVVADVQAEFTAMQATGAFTGEYYSIASFAGTSTSAGMDANVQTNNGTEGTGTMDFAWGSGTSDITWS